MYSKAARNKLRRNLTSSLIPCSKIATGFFSIRNLYSKKEAMAAAANEINKLILLMGSSKETEEINNKLDHHR